MKNILAILLAFFIAAPALAADYTRSTTTQSISTYTPTTGGTVTLTRSNDTVAVINPATDIATLTIALPAAPKDGDRVTINAAKSIGALTFSGGTVTNPLRSLASGSSFSLINITGTWKPLNGPSTTGALNLRDFGLPTGGDDTAALNAIFLAAKEQGRPVEVPCGTYNHLTELTIDSIMVRGQGLCSIFNATDTATSNPHMATYIKGTGTEVVGINFSSTNTSAARSTQLYASALVIPYSQDLSNFRIEGNYFTGYFAGAFIELSYSGTNGIVTKNTMTGTAKANPIILQAPVSKVSLIDNIVSADSGDTCIEIVDYTDQAVSTNQDINVIGNSLSGCGMLTGAGGHGISVVGGNDINILGNTISRVAARGIYIASETVNTTSTTSNINVVSNTITNAAIRSADFYILAVGRTQDRPVRNINISNNILDINTTVSVGISAGSCDTCSVGNVRTKEISISNNIISGDGTHGTIGVQARGAEDVTITNNKVSNLLSHGIYSCCGNTGSLKVSGNDIKNANISNGTAYAIYLGNSGFTHHAVSNNTYSKGTYAVTAFLGCSSSVVPDISVSGSSGDDTSIKTCLAKVDQPSTLPSVKTTGYTLALSDAGNFIQMGCGSACNLTVPPNSSVGFNIGQVICFQQTGAGGVTVAQGSGVTVNAFNSRVLNGLYATGCVKKTATDTWQAVGNFQ